MIKNNLEYNQSTFPNSAFEDYLKKVLPEYFKDNQFNYDKFKQDLNANDISEFSDGYQLKFIGKDYARKQAGDKTTTVLVPNKEHNEKTENTNSKNLFFTGDNLEVLRHLRNAYTKKIDVIYIDPPYNTGNKDFTYPDKFDYSDEELENIFGITDDELIKFNNIKNSSSHSAWLTFMYPRLWLAKQLLTDDGVIFVSIDDNEQANLKLLMDDIFGESNFVGDFIRKTRSSSNDPKSGFNEQHEYCLIYSKNNLLVLSGDNKDFSKYKNPDNDPNGDWIKDNPSARSGSKNSLFEIENPYTGQIDVPPKGRYWAFSKNTFEKWVSEGKVVFEKEITKGRGFFVKKYKKELKNLTKHVDSLIFNSNDYLNTNGTKELKNNYFSDGIFSSPKPIEFIKKIISFIKKSDIVVLDFFAGSATTADAIMQLNAEDNGNRKFIMVQLPEKTYKIDKNGNEVPTKGGENAFELGYKTIDEVSRERIMRAAKKIKSEHNGADDLDLGFKHYYCVEPKQDLVDEIIEFNPNEIDLFSSNMIEPFSAKSLGVNSSSTGVDTILTTWLIDDGYDITNIDLTIDKINDYYVYKLDNERIYLIDDNWNSNNTAELVNYLNNNPTYKSIVLYGYSFSVNDLDELKNTINQLNNKVNLFVRY